MTWETKRLLLVVKAYPQRSRKHGDLVCTAGITQEGEWVRLYPIDFQRFRGYHKLKRYTVIECECKRDTRDKLGRKESYRVREGSIRVVSTRLADPVDWAARKDWILPFRERSLEELRARYEEDKVSLGLIRPKEVIDLISTLPIRTDLHKRSDYQMTIEGEQVPIVTKIPNQFKYRFYCEGCGEGRPHETVCEDWELLESYRRWGEYYHTPDEMWEKLRDRFFHSMRRDTDLHFLVGMHSVHPTWLIIGLFYPPMQPGNEGAFTQSTWKDFP